MANMRTTVILKTDIVDSTPRTAGQTQAEMSLQRKQHKRFISDIAIKNRGSVFMEEGDAYWIELPSVTTAVLAAIEMHQELRATQTGKGEQQRLAIRAVVTVGDILYQETDAIGTTLSLTARIEKITPPDEIYLSHAAWLVLNKAEVQTSFVSEFFFKGFVEPEKIYKVDQKSGIRVITDQCIVFADANGFSRFSESNSMEVIENFLLEYDDLMNTVCQKHSGIIRQVNGDLYFMTFNEADQAISAIKMIWMNWKGIRERCNVGISIGIHKGNLNVFRSYVFGEDINTTMILSNLGRIYRSDINHISVVTSGRIRDELKGTEDKGKFQELEVDKLTEETHKIILREHGAFWFLAEGDLPR